MLNYAVIFIVFFCVCAYSPPIEFPEVFSRVLWSSVLCYLKRKVSVWLCSSMGCLKKS